MYKNTFSAIVCNEESHSQHQSSVCQVLIGACEDSNACTCQYFKSIHSVVRTVIHEMDGLQGLELLPFTLFVQQILFISFELPQYQSAKLNRLEVKKQNECTHTFIYYMVRIDSRE